MTGFRQAGLNGWRLVERGFDSAFGSRLNPLRHLGAVACLAFMLIAASGAILYAVLDTSASGAYRSIEELTRSPWHWGSLLRGIHRYAADTFAIAVALHIVREWLHGHDSGFRRFSWLTGVPLVGLAAAAAIGGFWINWDQLGQYSAIATAEWIDALPLLSTPLARNFLSAGAVSDRLFSLFVFVHLGVPLLLVFGIWFHLQRIARPAVLPPRQLALGLGFSLLALAGIWPVVSHAPAALASVPQVLRLDWLLLFIHPVVEATAPLFAWGMVIGGFGLLFMAPWLGNRASPAAAVAVVDAANCNGCRRCFADCPYAAITMTPHPNQRVGREMAVVDADLCAACGICAGACPSSTPFRGVAELVTGIDMPQLTVSALRKRLRKALESTPLANRTIVVFGCDHALPVDALNGDDILPFSSLCTGQLPPSFIEYALRDGAAGVLVTACPEGSCEFRFGTEWTAQRLAGRREPHLRASIERERIAFVEAGLVNQSLLQDALERLRLDVKSLPLPQRELRTQPGHV